MHGGKPLYRGFTWHKMAVDSFNNKPTMILNGYPPDTYWVLQGGKKNAFGFLVK
jgi:hypothetical protein